VIIFAPALIRRQHAGRFVFQRKNVGFMTSVMEKRCLAPIVITETEWKHVPEDSMVELAAAYEDWFIFYPSGRASALLILP